MPMLKLDVAGVDFEFDADLNLNVQVVVVNFKIEMEVFPARLGFVWGDDGIGQLRKISWTERPLKSLPEGGLQKIANLCAEILLPLNMWSGPQTEKGVRLQLGTGRPPPGELGHVWFSHRPGILKLSSPPWDSLWPRIERRVDFDEAFAVQGFGRAEVKQAIAQLSKTFPWDWVQARYRAAGFHYANADFGPGNDGYFPAYQFARTASGALCIDAGWKYLAELGLAMDKLQKLNGIDRLRRGLASQTGTQHHVCMAADFFDRGLLRGLEPEVGSGSARNDLLVELKGRNHQIELKEFSSATPIKKLKRELAEKAAQLSEKPDAPVIFHAVLLEQAGLIPEREKEFCRSIEENLSDVPKNISAIVVGRRFMDSDGGKIKRDTLQTFLMPNAATPTSEDDLRELFPANYEKLKYPLFGLNAPMHFGENTLELGQQ
jgi:hypothetical protein